MNKNKILEAFSEAISKDISRYLKEGIIKKEDMAIFASGYTLGCIKILIVHNTINVTEALEIGNLITDKVEKSYRLKE